MAICFSGAYTDSNLARKVYKLFESKYSFLSEYVVEVYHCDLSDDNVKGYQEKNGDEFLLHIEATLEEDEYIKTILHELVHCIQDIKGINDDDKREDEAYTLEERFYAEFKQGVTTKVT